MILKLLLIISVIFVVYIMFFKKKTINNAQPNSKKTSRKNQEANEMVECATCGIYCELDEAILSNAKYYCSTECLQKEI